MVLHDFLSLFFTIEGGLAVLKQLTVLGDHMVELRFTKHALERLFARSISPNDCLEVYNFGETIA